MIRELTIKNYKSILDLTIELGRINVFIGENGCGKTNILEAVAMAGATLENKLSVEDLFIRGIRTARPSLTLSSFPDAASKEIVLRCTVDPPLPSSLDLHLVAKGGPSSAGWVDKEFERARGYVATLGGAANARTKMQALDKALEKGPIRENKRSVTYQLPESERLTQRDATAVQNLLLSSLKWAAYHPQLSDFAVYNLSALALRGLQVLSRREPLGIYGENLDRAIATMRPAARRDLLDRVQCVSWVEDIVVDPGNKLKEQGYKLGQSQSNLYFRDRFMRRRSNIFSAENVNEGILHILFYFALFVVEGTPPVFGIDNIDTALNPQLCRDLVKQLADLAKTHDKQALITTHNPAILDGLNLHDDEQRLFVVYRNDEGHTVAKRIKAKPEPGGQKLKLSELWMRGHLGGIPRSF